MPNFIEIKKVVDGGTHGHLRPTLLGRLCRRVDLKIFRRIQLRPNYLRSLVSCNICQLGISHCVAYFAYGAATGGLDETRVVFDYVRSLYCVKT